MGKQIDVLADLRGVVRIARAASHGVTGNVPRIAAAERAIAAIAELIEAASAPVLRASPDDRNWRERKAAFARLDAALSNIEGGQ